MHIEQQHAEARVDASLGHILAHIDRVKEDSAIVLAHEPNPLRRSLWGVLGVVLSYVARELSAWIDRKSNDA